VLGLVISGPSFALVEHTWTLPASCEAYRTSGTPSATCVNESQAAWTSAGCTGGGAYFAGGTRNTTTTWPVYYTPSSYVQPVWSCVKGTTADSTFTDIWLMVDACAATAGQSLTGTVSRTGEPSASNPPPQTVCHNSCTYTLSSAVPATGLDGTELWSGTWIGEGEGGSCTGGTTPTEGGETAGDAAAGDRTAPADASETTYDAGIAALNSSTSPVGAWYSLPSWVTGLLSRQSTDCKLHINVPAGGVLGSVRDRLQNIDVCGVQQYADTFGNWFMWFCAMLWSWVIVTGGRTDGSD